MKRNKKPRKKKSKGKVRKSEEKFVGSWLSKCTLLHKETKRPRKQGGPEKGPQRAFVGFCRTYALIRSVVTLYSTAAPGPGPETYRSSSSTFAILEMISNAGFSEVKHFLRLTRSCESAAATSCHPYSLFTTLSHATVL